MPRSGALVAAARGESHARPESDRRPALKCVSLHEVRWAGSRCCVRVQIQKDNVHRFGRSWLRRVALARLGAVQRGVGGSHERIEFERARRRGHETDAGPNPYFPTLDQVRFGDRPVDTLGEMVGHIRLQDRSLDDHELIASDTGDRRLARYEGAQPIRDRLKELVTSRVSILVVDRLEAIQIQAMHGDRVPARLGKHAAERLARTQAVQRETYTSRAL